MFIFFRLHLKNKCYKCNNCSGDQMQCCGSGSGSAWIRIILAFWIRIRIQVVQNMRIHADPDQDPKHWTLNNAFFFLQMHRNFILGPRAEPSFNIIPSPHPHVEQTRPPPAAPGSSLRLVPGRRLYDIDGVADGSAHGSTTTWDHRYSKKLDGNILIYISCKWVLKLKRYVVIKLLVIS